MIEILYHNIALKTAYPALFLTAWAIMAITATTIAFSVAYKFAEYKAKLNTVVKHQNHVIDTFSMTIIAVFIFNLLISNIGAIKLSYTTSAMALIWGTLLAFIATWLHLWSKQAIGLFWSNKIEITKEHQIVTSGPYAIVRHPMYSSLILWLAAISIMFVNYIGLVASLFIFTPIIVWRAKSEDKLLKELDNTAFMTFANKTHMLIPHFGIKLSIFMRLVGIALLGYSIVLNQMDLERIGFLFVMFISIGLSSDLAKVRFSYLNKAFFLFVFYGLITAFPKAYPIYYIILIFNIWSLKFNCPCMAVYEKYHGCPCFKWLKKSCRINK